MDYDPLIANASAKDLIRMVDLDQNASHRERCLCEFLSRCSKETYSPLEQAEARADEAEEKAQESESIIKEARNDMQKIIDRLDAFL